MPAVAAYVRPQPAVEVLPGRANTKTVTVQDDGTGNIAGGTIDYGTGEIANAVYTRSYSYPTWSVTRVGGEVTAAQWTAQSDTEQLAGGASLRVEYCRADQAAQPAVTGLVGWAPSLEIDFLRGVREPVVPGTVRFTLGGKRYSDRDGLGGVLYWDDGTVAGQFDYQHGKATITEWTGAVSGTVVVQSMISTRGEYWIDEAFFRAASAPLAPGSLQVVATQQDGDSTTATGDTDGVVTGTGITAGTVEHDIGAIALEFSEPVYPGTLLYSATAFTIIPLDPAVVGIDPVRLPPDGRVPVIRAGDYVVVYEDFDTALPNPAVAGATYALGEQFIAYARLEDGAGEQTEELPSPLGQDQTVQLTRGGRTGPLEYLVLEDARARPIAGALYDIDLANWTITTSATFSADGYEEPFLARFLALVDPDLYSVDRDAGTITMASPLDLSGYTQPLEAIWRVHDLALCGEAQTTGAITLQSPLTHDYTTAAAVSAMLLHGDLVARVFNAFQQHSDNGTWLDYLSGSAPTGGGRYDFTGYPVRVTNAGAIRERWRLKRRSDAKWDIIGETLGVIGIWDGASMLEARRSPSQVHPYWTLFAEGLGTGWATGNFIQFETSSSQGPLWVLRSVAPGRPTVTTDAIRIRHRVGAD